MLVDPNHRLSEVAEDDHRVTAPNGETKCSIGCVDARGERIVVSRDGGPIIDGDNIGAKMGVRDRRRRKQRKDRDG